MSAECCMCRDPATVFTAIIEEEYFATCSMHHDLWLRTREDISFRDWCRRITSPSLNGVRPVSKDWLSDFIDEYAPIC